jgi:hypothetical protein
MGGFPQLAHGPGLAPGPEAAGGLALAERVEARMNFSAISESRTKR